MRKAALSSAITTLRQRSYATEKTAFPTIFLRPDSPLQPSACEICRLAERRTEPNSGLGQAIGYLLRHWQPLTLFLRKAGAPLDNNVAERALKRAVLHRKNALFYRTLHGAQVGDLFMSLIHTCQLCGANSFDYLVELQRHARELAACPAEWMPWNYRDTLARSVQRADSAEL